MSTLVVLLVAPVLAGVIVGHVSGGRVAALATPRIKAGWLLWLAAAVEIVRSVSGLPLIALAFAPVIIWVALNVIGSGPVLRVGLLLTMLGLLANGTAIALNGRMPFEPAAAELAGFAPTVVTSKNAPANRDTLVSWLGDTIPIPPMGAVISIGDIAIVLGVMAIVAGMMRPEREDRAVTNR